MTTMLYVSVLLTALYAGVVIWRRRGLPESLSAMVYDLRDGRRWLWILWLWSVAFSVAPSLLDALPEAWKPAGAATVFAMAFCGAMPIAEDSRNEAHNVLGILAGILSQVCVAVISPWWLLLWLPFLIAFVVLTSGTEPWREIVFWAEATCGASLFGAILT